MASGPTVVPPRQEKREAHVRRAKTLWLCLLPLLLFAAGAARAGAAGERDVALISFDPMSDQLSATHMCRLDIIYDGTLVSTGLRGYHLEITFDDTYVYVDSLDVHVTEGSFLSDVGGTAFFVEPVNESAVVVDCTILGATTGAMGVGDLCSITFKGRTGDGVSVVEFAEVTLRDPDNQGILASSGFAVLTLDNTPPNVPVFDPEPEFTPGTTNYVSWSDESPSGALGYCIEASETPTFDVIVSTSGCTPYNYHTFLGLTDGQIYYYRVQCRDDLWNVSDWSATEESTQDDTPPDTEAGPVGPYYNTISFDVPFTAYDATSGVQYVEFYYRRDGGAYVQYGSSFTVSPIAFVAPGEGVYELYTIGTDNVDNVEDAPVAADCTTEIDLTPPPAPVDLVALPGHNKISLSWTVPAARDAPIEGTLLVRRPWSIWAYPEYDDWGAPFGYPAHQANGFVVAFIPGTGDQTYEDDSFSDASRNVHYYTAFTRDSAGNYSIATSTAQDRSTSYWLADVREPTGTPGTYDGFVDYYDKVAYSYSYYSIEGDPQYDNELDVGPTDDNSRMGIPLTDNIINFEDLMILAMNYGRVYPTGIPDEGLPDPTIGDYAVLALEWERAELVIGDVLEISLTLLNSEQPAKGVSSVVTFDSDALEFLSAIRGEFADDVEESFFFAREEAGRIRIDFAVLGTETSMPGSRAVATLRFRVSSAEPSLLDIDEVTLRDVANADVACRTSGLDLAGGDEVSLRLRLGQNAPNPFNPRTVIAFDLPERCSVALRIYGVDGRDVVTLVDGPLDAGAHRVTWDGTDDRGADAASGVYFYVLDACGRRLSQKMVLMR